jgi:hypothetical protein
VIKIGWPEAVAACVVALTLYGLTPSSAQETTGGETAGIQQLPGGHAECSFFGPERERFLPRGRGTGSVAGRVTRQFAAANLRTRLRTGKRARSFEAAQSGKGGLIDQYIWADLQANNITPAGQTTDFEFTRRVTLDLTGRIPTADRLNQFIADTDPNKRARLVDELLAKPQWVDKWTMYFGDLYKNTIANTQVNIRAEGRNAFYKYLHDSMAANKPYNQMASEIIGAQGNNNWDQSTGQINYLILGINVGGPAQDYFDSQTAAVANHFLGLAHMNCVLCHNGRGHLDNLSLWGSRTTRVQAWGLSAFMAHTWVRTLTAPQDPNNPNVRTYYFSLDKYASDYALNTTTGNRPARQPIGTVKTIAPAYLFGGQTPDKGEDYRAALARLVTGDPQFARAAVNYIWAQFLGRGIVDPPDQFDPLRLDPDNPPPAPWTLQPTNARLLNALAQWFIDSGYDLQALMRLIANSDTYQLASEYDGAWDPAWEPYFGRKLVRRLWGEEIHDSIVTALQYNLPGYTVPGFTNASTIYGVTSPGFGKISYAMQAPDVVNMPDGGGAVSQFLDTFLRGNRDDQPRKSEGSILQALGLMNDNFVESRIHATGTGPTATYLTVLLSRSDAMLVNTLFLDVLSRYPTADERELALQKLAAGGAAARKANAEDLLWTLFNKVDFVFNY